MITLRYNSKLTSEQANEIVRRRRTGERAKTIAFDFGVTEARVYQLSKQAGVQKPRLATCCTVG